MKKFPIITTIPQFCEACGWPEDALDGMRYSAVLELLALYDLTVGFKFSPKKCPLGKKDCAMCKEFDDGYGY